MKKTIITLILTLLISGCVSRTNDYQPNEEGLIDVNMQIDGAAVPYYAPLYLAKEKGYFEDEGMNVNFYYASAAEIVKNVGSDNVEFGFPNADPVIMGRANGVPIKIVHTTLQNGLGSVIFKDKSKIKTPQDLKGKTIAITSFGSPNYSQLKILLEKNELTIDDVNVEIIGTGAIVNALVSDQVDAISFSMLRTYELLASGEEVSEFRSNEITTTYGNVVVVSDRFLKENSDLVAGFNRALNKSLQYIIDGNLEEAVDLSIEHYAPNAKGNEAKFIQILQDAYIKDLWQSQDTNQYGFGYNNPDRYKDFIDNLYEYDLIKEPYDVNELIIKNGHDTDE